MEELIVQNKPKSPISEAFRSLRTNIQFANVDHNMKAIGITSATPGEGKTLVMANLAVAMAQTGHKVLVIDCDMRKPRVHKILKLSNNEGLADLLLKGGDRSNYLQKVGPDEMTVLTAGHIPTNPSELLNSQAMKQLLESFKKEFDYIFIDSPPVTPVTDAAILSTYLDGMILVVASGKVDIDLIKRSKESLQNVDANILGVVLNKVKSQDQKNYYSYYYYYAQEEKE